MNSSCIDVITGATALVLDSPHSGTDYPEDFGAACSMPALRVAEDTYVDELWAFATGLGASMVQARFPRSYVDVNRALDEIDETLLDQPWPGPVNRGAKVRLGKGLVWRMLDDGTPIYNRSLSVAEVQSRIDRCWHPYHQALDQVVTAARARHGHVIHLDCHSMPSVAQAYSTDHPWLVHADFVLGDRDGTSADPRLTQWIAQFLCGLGYSVSVNHPYKGVEIVRRHGQPARGQHAIQLEINKRLYMDEVSLKKTTGFPLVQDTLRALTEALLVFNPLRYLSDGWLDD